MEKLSERLPEIPKNENSKPNSNIGKIVEGLSGAHYLIVGKDQELGYEVEYLEDYTEIRPKEGLYIGRFKVVTEEHIANRYKKRIEAIKLRRSSQNKNSKSK